MKFKTRIAHFLLYGSSILKASAKMLLKDDHLLVDALSVPGWHIVDGLIIRDYLTRGRLFLDITWEYWEMPKAYIDAMNRLKRNISERKISY